jgi:hypothetical protein
MFCTQTCLHVCMSLSPSLACHTNNILKSAVCIPSHDRSLDAPHAYAVRLLTLDAPHVYAVRLLTQLPGQDSSDDDDVDARPVDVLVSRVCVCACVCECVCVYVFVSE